MKMPAMHHRTTQSSSAHASHAAPSVAVRSERMALRCILARKGFYVKGEGPVLGVRMRLDSSVHVPGR